MAASGLEILDPSFIESGLVEEDDSAGIDVAEIPRCPVALWNPAE
jgi:hypothetical protein